MKLFFCGFLLLSAMSLAAQNKDPLATKIVTEDLDRFWVALEKAGDEVKPEILDQYYLKPGTKGVEGFMNRRIRSAEHLAEVIRSHKKYYHSFKPSADSLARMENQIRQSLIKLKDYYSDAIFPPVYFVVGALSSGGTSSDDGLIIGVEMHGLTPNTPKEELNDWLKTVLKPVSQVPHIVAHELIHFQQHNSDGETLLSASIEEGECDFLAELISGKHINDYVHDYANPKEKELWNEFKNRLDDKNYKDWFYTPASGRPNDLGYWMGYKITRAYFEKASDKKAAVKAMLNINDFKKFLKDSGYEDKFK